MTGYSLKSVKGFITADVLTAPDGNIQLGNVTISNNLGNVTTSDFLPFDLAIAPEVLTIQISAPEAGNDIHWLWTWETSTLPYARAKITNQQQISVPLYKQGTYQLNNFANEQTGNMTQRHMAKLKWIDGAGYDNLVSWAVDTGNVVYSHPDINGGANTTVQRTNISVPANLTIPTLNAPNVTYDVSHANVDTFTIGNMGVGENRNLGPVYRGGTYTFDLDSSLASHPFYLTTDNGTGFVANSYVGEYTSGVTGSRNDGSAGKTTLTFVVPSNAPDTLYYQSATNANMRGAITIKDLAVETNINGNYVLYLQHMKEGHKTPIEIRPIPSLVNQMCLVYDQTTNQFVPQDLATYVENTPSFKNKIREVAGTATLIAPNGVAVVPTVLVVEDVSYLPLVDNKNGDIAFDSYTDTMYVWDTNAWKSTKPTSIPTVTANAQPNITSVGNLTSLNMSGNILPTANVTYNLGSPTMAWKDLYLSGNSIFVGGQTISASANGFSFSTKVALPANTTVNGTVLTAPLPQSKTYYWKGGLVENVSTMRYYIPTTSTLTAINATLGTTGLTQTTLVVKKNGTAINTITIPANTATVNQTVSISLAANDYLTVDITQSSSAKDAYVVFIYS